MLYLLATGIYSLDIRWCSQRILSYRKKYSFCVSCQFYSTGKVVQLTCLIIWSIMFQQTYETSKVEAWYWTEKTPGLVQKVLIYHAMSRWAEQWQCIIILKCSFTWEPVWIFQYIQIELSIVDYSQNQFWQQNLMLCLPHSHISQLLHLRPAQLWV